MQGSSFLHSAHLLPALMLPPLSVSLQAAWLPAEDPAGLQQALGSSLPRLPLDRLARTGQDGAAPDSPLDLSAIRSGHAQLPDSQRSHRATPMVLTGKSGAPEALRGKDSIAKRLTVSAAAVQPAEGQVIMLHGRP